MRRLCQTCTKLIWILANAADRHLQNLEEGRKILDFNDLGQFLSSEVESDGFCIAWVVDFDVNLVIILIFPDERSFQTGHLVLLPMDQDLRRKALFSDCCLLGVRLWDNSAVTEAVSIKMTGIESYHVWWFESPDELAGLLVVSVG